MQIRVTITGADDSVDPKDLQRLSREYKFVEWGILFSPDKLGVERYPSMDWVRSFHDKLLATSPAAHAAAHLCKGYATGTVLPPYTIAGFRRVQFNVAGEFTPSSIMQARRVLKAHRQVLMQISDSAEIADAEQHFSTDENMRIGYLFDRSRGNGTWAPESWQRPLSHVAHVGYAGGIDAETVFVALDIAYRVTNIWQRSSAHGAVLSVDMESGVRTGSKFDLEKVTLVLERAYKWLLDREI